MPTSGTLGTTVFDNDTIQKHAMMLAGLPASRLTPENVLLIKESLYLLMLELTAMGTNLWSIQQGLFGLYPGRIRVPLPAGTTDVLNFSYRQLSRVYPSMLTSSAGGTVSYLQDDDIDTIFTQGGVGGSLVIDNDDGLPVNVLGLLPATTGTWGFTLEQSLDGITYTPLLVKSGLDVNNGEWLWYQLEPSSTQRYVRLSADATTTLSLRELFVCSSYTDIPMYRMNRDDYSSMPFKQSQTDATLQFWLDRGFTSTDMVLWPGPKTTFSCLWLMLYQETQDVGLLTDTLAVPPRAFPGIVKRLARDILLKVPGGDLKRLPLLEQMAKDAVFIGRADERDNSPVFIAPNISPYTR
jgi:hypothetical protein